MTRETIIKGIRLGGALCLVLFIVGIGVGVSEQYIAIGPPPQVRVAAVATPTAPIAAKNPTKSPTRERAEELCRAQYAKWTQSMSLMQEQKTARTWKLTTLASANDSGETLLKMRITSSQSDDSPATERYYYCLVSDTEVLKHGISDTWPPDAINIFKPHPDTPEEQAWKSLVFLSTGWFISIVRYSGDIIRWAGEDDDECPANFARSDSSHWLDPAKIQSLAEQAISCLDKAQQAADNSDRKTAQHLQAIDVYLDQLKKWHMVDPSVQYQRLFPQ